MNTNMSPPAHATMSNWELRWPSRSISSLGTIGRMTGTLSPRRAELRFRTLYQTATVPHVTGTTEQMIAKPSSRAPISQVEDAQHPDHLPCDSDNAKHGCRARPAGIACPYRNRSNELALTT